MSNAEEIHTEIKEVNGCHSVQLTIGSQKFYLQGTETKKEAKYMEKMFNKAIQCE